MVFHKNLKFFNFYFESIKRLIAIDILSYLDPCFGLNLTQYLNVSLCFTQQSCFSLFQSLVFFTCLLSYNFFPFATAISTLTFLQKYNLVGITVRTSG